MAGDFNPLTAPAVMPRDVKRTDSNGFPTQYMLDWEQALKGWTTSQVNYFNQQITTVEDSIGDISANGEIQFKAIATPIGAVAAYGLFLQAGASFTGMEMIAATDGTSSIAFNASRFQFNDSGTAQNVFDYSGGLFTFNVPVKLFNNELANDAVTRAWTSYGTNTANVDIEFRGTGFLEVYAQFMGDSNVYGTIDQFVLKVWEGGTMIGETPITQAQNGTGVTAASRYGATSIIYIRTPGAGPHNYKVEIEKTIAVSPLMLSGVLIVVKEYSK